MMSQEGTIVFGCHRVAPALLDRIFPFFSVVIAAYHLFALSNPALVIAPGRQSFYSVIYSNGMNEV